MKVKFEIIRNALIAISSAGAITASGESLPPKSPQMLTEILSSELSSESSDLLPGSSSGAAYEMPEICSVQRVLHKPVVPSKPGNNRRIGRGCVYGPPPRDREGHIRTKPTVIRRDSTLTTDSIGAEARPQIVVPDSTIIVVDPNVAAPVAPPKPVTPTTPDTPEQPSVSPVATPPADPSAKD